MSRFPDSYGSLDLSKYPKSAYLNVTFPDGVTRPSIVLPVSDKWMRVYTDKTGATHSDISVSLDDATGLNSWAASKAAQEGKTHTDFHAQIHITPGKQGRKEWADALMANLQKMNPAELDEVAKKYKLDMNSIASSDYYRNNPSKVPNREEIISRIAHGEMNRLTAAGRIYAPSLSKTDIPAPAGAATATAIQNVLATQPQTQPSQTGDVDQMFPLYPTDELPF